MQDYQKRVVEEKSNLDDKIVKLHKFIGGELYLSLDEPSQELFKQQYEFMTGYSAILELRISNF